MNRKQQNHQVNSGVGVYLKKSARNFGSVLIGIETDTPESFERLMDLANDKGFSARDITNDEVLSSFLV